jgi:hypothetical protein
VHVPDWRWVQLSFDSPIAPDFQHTYASACEALRRAEMFAPGPIGVAGQTPEELFAVAHLLRREDAGRVFANLFYEADGNAGRAYALLGLRWAKASTYRDVLGRLEASRARVTVMHGCSMWMDDLAVVARDIEAGRHDQYRPPGTGEASRP